MLENRVFGQAGGGTCLLLNACYNDIGTCIFQDSNG